MWKPWEKWEYRNTWYNFLGDYEDQIAVIRTEYGDTDRFRLRKGVRQGCILSPFLFNMYAERIMRQAGMDEAEAGIKIAGRIMNNLIYADDTILLAGKKPIW